MKYFTVNRDGINAKLLDPKLQQEDRDFIHAQVQRYSNTSIYVRVCDGERIRKLLNVPADMESFEQDDPR